MQGCPGICNVMPVACTITYAIMYLRGFSCLLCCVSVSVCPCVFSWGVVLVVDYVCGHGGVRWLRIRFIRVSYRLGAFVLEGRGRVNGVCSS